MRRTPKAVCERPPEGGRFCLLDRRHMEITGFEPVTPCVQSRCSTRLSYIPVVRSGTHTRRHARDQAQSARRVESVRGPGPVGGPRWARTTDLPVISRMLCQLSYEPALLRRRRSSSQVSKERSARPERTAGSLRGRQCSMPEATDLGWGTCLDGSRSFALACSLERR
jgi:hypothetical protein